MQALPHATDNFRPFPRCLDVSAALSETITVAAENSFLRKHLGLWSASAAQGVNGDMAAVTNAVLVPYPDLATERSFP
jgi:hypothetical protein